MLTLILCSKLQEIQFVVVFVCVTRFQPLHLALLHAHEDAALALVKAGAKVDIDNVYSQNANSLAAQLGKRFELRFKGFISEFYSYSIIFLDCKATRPSDIHYCNKFYNIKSQVDQTLTRHLMFFTPL